MTSPTVNIRRAVASDAEAFRDLRLLALQNEPDAFGSTYAESSLRPAAEWISVVTSMNYYLAFDGERAVGMASGGDYSPYPFAKWLYGMFVRPEYRGTGVAQDLVREVAKWTREQGCDQLGLHVTTTVHRAVAFYERLGFTKSGPPEPMDRDHRLLLQVMTTNVRTNDRL